jgi:hypothetical protein
MVFVQVIIKVRYNSTCFMQEQWKGQRIRIQFFLMICRYLSFVKKSVNNFVVSRNFQVVTTLKLKRYIKGK